MSLDSQIARAFKRRGSYKTHQLGISAARFTVTQIAKRLSTPKTSWIKHLYPVGIEVYAHRAPYKQRRIFAMNAGVCDCLAKNLFGDFSFLTVASTDGA